jgi:phosphoribosylanthranilate isomerase
VKVKICGITNIDDAWVAVKYGADALGFIFYSDSKRYIKPDEAKNIIDQLPHFIMKVGVFVNESYSKINEIAKHVGLNTIQLHGEERQDLVENINLPVLKAFRISDRFDFTILDSYKNCSFLLDAFDSTDYGGTGKTFKWELIPEDIRRKIILAGGINSTHIKLIAKEISPQAIDVSSSIEDSPGIKNHAQLIELLNKVNELKDK